MICDVTKVQAHAGASMVASVTWMFLQHVKANDKAACIGGFSFCYVIPGAEDAISQEMEGVRQEACPGG